MVQISNKPNISGIKDVSEDAEYSSKLLAREGKLVVIPAIAKLCGC